MKVTKRPLGQHRMPQHLPYGVLWDNIKCPNICLIGVPKEEEKEKDNLREGQNKILSKY